MRHIKLIARSDEYDSKPGFALAGTADFDGFMADREGTLIAHDLIEHQNGVRNMGPVWDELEALGGIWQVRGRWGDMCSLTGAGSAYSPAQNVASDLTRMFPEWIGEGRSVGPRGDTVGTRPHLYDDDFAEIIAHARNDIPREYDYMSEEQGDDLQYVEEYLALALRRMRAGFRKAERRFGDRFHGINTFKAIQAAVASASREIEFEGQEFRLSYGDGDARCVEIYSEWE